MKRLPQCDTLAWRPDPSQALSNAKTLTELQMRLALVWQVIERLPTGVILWEAAWQARLVTPRAQQLLEEFFAANSGSGNPLPWVLNRWILQQEGFLDRADAPPARMPLVVRQKGKKLEERVTTLQPAPLETFHLSPRETEVLFWVAQGKTNAGISTILTISSRTVQKHLEHIFYKLGTETRTEAAAMVWKAPR